MPKPSSRKVSSSKLAQIASQALRDGRSSRRTRSLAGSVLSQARKGRRR